MKEKSVRLVVLGIMLVLLASAAVGTASAKQEGNIFTPDYKPKDEVYNLTYLLAANGLSERDLEDMKNYFTYSENDRNEVDPYSNPNLGKFFNGKEESRFKQYLRKAGKLVKKHGPAAVIAGLFFAAPIACVGNVGVANAKSNDQSDGIEWYEKISWDKIKGSEHAKIKSSKDILNWGDEFGYIDKPFDEPIKTPEEIAKEFFMKYFWYDKEGYPHYKDFEIAPTDWSVFGAAYIGSTLNPNLSIFPVDTDKDDKPETLMPTVTDYNLRNTDIGPIDDNIVCYTLPTGEKFIKYRTYYILDPFHKPKDENIQGILKLLYTNPDWKIVPLEGEDVVEPLYWKEVVGKTPAELGLDKYDRGIFGRPPNQTSSPAESTPSEVPKGEEKGISGFEAMSAVAGLVAVAYVLRRQRR